MISLIQKMNLNLRPFWLFPAVATVTMTAVSPVLASQQDAINKTQSATQLFATEMSNPKTQIPRYVLRNALGIAIIPNIVKAGFIIGGTRGAGVLSVRNSKGAWSNPAFVSLTGGSVGFQFGGQSSDAIIVFNTQNGISKALNQDFNIGGSVSATGGPSGVSPVTSSSAVPDVYTYTRNQQGLFAGISLQGTKLGIEQKRNADFYGMPGITVEQIFKNPPPAPPVAATFRQVLGKYAPYKK
jgi:SH3 domain-containing YSC84-like protein 1